MARGKGEEIRSDDREEEAREKCRKGDKGMRADGGRVRDSKKVRQDSDGRGGRGRNKK